MTAHTHKHAAERRKQAAKRERYVAAGLTTAGRPRKNTFDRLAYLETAVAEGATIIDAAKALGVEPLSIYQLCYRHGRTDLWYALKGRTVTWKRDKR